MHIIIVVIIALAKGCYGEVLSGVVDLNKHPVGKQKVLRVCTQQIEWIRYRYVD